MGKFLADENVSQILVDSLKRNNVDVIYIKDIAPSVSDMEVLRISVEENRIILTDDKDFGDMVYRDHQNHIGIILMRFAGMPLTVRADIMSGILTNILYDFYGKFTVISKNGQIRNGS